MDRSTRAEAALRSTPLEACSPTRPVTVRLFAALREQAGWSERPIALEADRGPLTPAGIWQELGLSGEPDGTGGASAQAIPPVIRIAVNQSFANADQVLQPGDEVAFLPPISGG
jgi:molybdopterin synthase sulfur carrier subunit